MTFFPCGLLVLVCMSLLMGINGGNCNKCIGVPKHLVSSAYFLGSKIHARK